MLNDVACGHNLVRCSCVSKRKGAWAQLMSSTLIFRQLYGLMQCMIIEEKNQMHLVSKSARRCGISLFRLSDHCRNLLYSSNDVADKSQSNAGLVLTILYRYLFVPLANELPLSLSLVRPFEATHSKYLCSTNSQVLISAFGIAFRSFRGADRIFKKQ